MHDSLISESFFNTHFMHTIRKYPAVQFIMNTLHIIISNDSNQVKIIQYTGILIANDTVRVQV